MKSDRSDSYGLVDRGPRIESTLDMSTGRLLRYDPGSKVPRRQMTQAERAWLARPGRILGQSMRHRDDIPDTFVRDNDTRRWNKISPDDTNTKEA